LHKYRDDPFTDWSLPFLDPLGRKLVGLDAWETREGEAEEGEEKNKKEERSNEQEGESLY
jgi:hypothetical protein